MYGIAAQSDASRIQTCHKPLGGGFFITGGAIDLPRQEQMRCCAQLQRCVQCARIDIVILDRISRLQNNGFFQPHYGMDVVVLNINRKRS